MFSKRDNQALIKHTRIALGVLLLGVAFALANTYYAFGAKAKDPQAPIDITYFKDYNQANGAYSVVRKGTRHPVAATL